MKNPTPIFILGALLLGSPAILRAEEPSFLAQADAAYAQREDVPQDKIAMVLYVRAAQADPQKAVESYWKAARAAWWLGEHEEKRAPRLDDYQLGMTYAQEALARDANSAESHFWLGANEGSYGDARGVMKSLSMVKPIRREMAEVLRINDRYDDGGAYQVLGVVDYKVPGFIGGNKTRAEKELRQAIAIGPNDPFNHYYLAEYYQTTGDRAKRDAELIVLRTLTPPPGLEPETRMLRERAARELK